MRVFFDENIPRQLRRSLQGHEVVFVENKGWKGKQNGELLRLVEAEFDVIVTSDGGVAFQNNLALRKLSMVVLPTPNLKLLRANALALQTTLDDLERLGFPAIVWIDWRGGRKKGLSLSVRAI